MRPHLNFSALRAAGLQTLVQISASDVRSVCSRVVRFLYAGMQDNIM